MESNLADQILDLKTVEASINPAEQYASTISSLLADSLSYKPHIIITTADIDQWMDVNAHKQSDESRRKR
jgi:hypothetical protein